MQGYKVDYLKLDTEEIALTVVWSILITSVLGRALFSYLTGAYYWGFLRIFEHSS